MIRLIEPVKLGSSSNALQFDVLGQQWAISEYSELADTPPFTCISYAWGKQNMKSPLNPEQEMSSRTIRVLEVAINTSRAQEDVSLYPNKSESSLKLSRKNSEGLYP